MKNNQTPQFMLALLITAALACNFSSCKKGDSSASSSTSTTVTEADVAELTTDGISTSTNGMVSQVNSSVNTYKTVKLSCGVQKDTTIVRASAAGSTPTFSYNLYMNYMVNCTGLVPSTLSFNFTGSGSFDGTLLSSTDKSTGGIILSGLAPTAANYGLVLNYSRTGNSTSKIGKQHTFKSTVQIQSTNIVIDKTSQQIISGAATVVITATSSSGKTFNFNGTVTFSGNKKATLVLNSGASYDIHWS